MRFDGIQIECLEGGRGKVEEVRWKRLLVEQHTDWRPVMPTSRISASVIEPWISCLFANTSRPAPSNLCIDRTNSASITHGNDVDERVYSPPLGAALSIRLCNRSSLIDRQNRLPISRRLFPQSNFASKVEGSFALLRPLFQTVAIKRNH
jgi:hypothetical protein